MFVNFLRAIGVFVKHFYMRDIIKHMYTIVLLGIVIVCSIVGALVGTETFTSGFTRFDCPTRNMSYDLRGDPYRPPRGSFLWSNSTIGC